ncbi:hypothetical protein [Paenibacillus sp. DMB20]|uniref:hypothetical protein n=1 Tax=Paenibacillus sp. DMB20 TaxID=1642570 RepID=UPI000AFA2A16|nr:hypothetical protein [Paenibacillus sp. DMB20]
MKVKELIELLSKHDSESEVQFGIWDPETSEAKETFTIIDVSRYDPFDPVLYIWDK